MLAADRNAIDTRGCRYSCCAAKPMVHSVDLESGGLLPAIQAAAIIVLLYGLSDLAFRLQKHRLQVTPIV
jgi:hypothetical protein